MTENDYLIDKIYPEIAHDLDEMIDSEIIRILDEYGVSEHLLKRIIDTWSLGISERAYMNYNRMDKLNKQRKTA